MRKVPFPHVYLPDHLSTGHPCQLVTPVQARKNLEVILAIEEAARRRETIRLPGSQPAS